MSRIKSMNKIFRDDDTIYYIKDLLEMARKGYFPFRSKTTIIKMAKKGIIPAHRAKIGDTNYYWWFIGKELVQWMTKDCFFTNEHEDSKSV